MIIENGMKIYHKGNDEIRAIDDVTLSFEMGKFYGIIGPSGSGKSTLIQILGLLDKLDSGKVIIDGKDVSKLDDLRLSKIRKDNIGFIFQSFYLNGNLKAVENVMLPMFLNSSLSNKERYEKAKELLNMVGLKNRINHYPKELSGGEEQRVAIARALSNNPNYILADEATGSLDSKYKTKIYDILKKLSESGKCIIAVSHDEIVKKYADVIIEIEDGKVKGRYEKKR